MGSRTDILIDGRGYVDAKLPAENAIPQTGRTANTLITIPAEAYTMSSETSPAYTGRSPHVWTTPADVRCRILP